MLITPTPFSIEQADMRHIAIIGNAGGGKSTLAQIVHIRSPRELRRFLRSCSDELL